MRRLQGGGREGEYAMGCGIGGEGSSECGREVCKIKVGQQNMVRHK